MQNKIFTALAVYFLCPLTSVSMSKHRSRTDVNSQELSPHLTWASSL